MSAPGKAKNPATVLCPTCGTAVTWNGDSPERPFCSRRCRLIDLGEWLDGGRAIPGDEAGDGAVPGQQREQDDPG